MGKLIKRAIKALEENLGFNEITLSDGKNTVHLVRFTPSPSLQPVNYPYPWQWISPQY